MSERDCLDTRCFGCLCACVLHFCICTCSRQLSMFHMKRRFKNALTIIITIIILSSLQQPFSLPDLTPLVNSHSVLLTVHLLSFLQAVCPARFTFVKSSAVCHLVLSVIFWFPLTWYLLEELKGISTIFLLRRRNSVTWPMDNSTHFNRADSEASPLHSLSRNE